MYDKVLGNYTKAIEYFSVKAYKCRSENYSILDKKAEACKYIDEYIFSKVQGSYFQRMYEKARLEYPFKYYDESIDTINQVLEKLINQMNII